MVFIGMKRRPKQKDIPESTNHQYKELTNDMKSVIALAMTATMAAANGRAPIVPPSDDGALFEKEDLAKTALLDCLTTKSAAASNIADAKAHCKNSDSGVSSKFDDWRAAGKRKSKNAIISEWYRKDPDVMKKLGELYPVDVTSVGADDTIKDVIGADADDQDIAQYKEKTGKAAWAETVKSCRASAANPNAKKECIEDTYADLCTKTANTVPCCLREDPDDDDNDGTAENGDMCTAEDSLRAIEEAADAEMSEETKKCSKTGGGTAAVKTCREALRTEYEAKTGKTMDAVGKFFFLFFLFFFLLS